MMKQTVFMRVMKKAFVWSVFLISGFFIAKNFLRPSPTLGSMRKKRIRDDHHTSPLP